MRPDTCRMTDSFDLRILGQDLLLNPSFGPVVTLCAVGRL